MRLLQDVCIASPVPCPYLEGKTFVQEYFFADSMDEREFDYFLSRGWRRFGNFFFRPRCPGCRACRPVRISAGGLIPGSAQRKAVNRNRDTRVELKPLAYSDEIFEIYRLHSLKFGEEERDRAAFRETYFQKAVPAFQTEYYREDTLAAVGFVDVGASGLSSVYYSYDPRFSRYSLGTFSVIHECRLAADAGLEWYYLGYYVAECPRMVYKGKFIPRQFYSWERERWEDG